MLASVIFSSVHHNNTSICFLAFLSSHYKTLCSRLLLLLRLRVYILKRFLLISFELKQQKRPKLPAVDKHLPFFAPFAFINIKKYPRMLFSSTYSYLLLMLLLWNYEKKPFAAQWMNFCVNIYAYMSVSIYISSKSKYCCFRVDFFFLKISYFFSFFAFHWEQFNKNVRRIL